MQGRGGGCGAFLRAVHWAGVQGSARAGGAAHLGQVILLLAAAAHFVICAARVRCGRTARLRPRRAAVRRSAGLKARSLPLASQQYLLEGKRRYRYKHAHSQDAVDHWMSRVVHRRRAAPQVDHARAYAQSDDKLGACAHCGLWSAQQAPGCGMLLTSTRPARIGPRHDVRPNCTTLAHASRNFKQCCAYETARQLGCREGAARTGILPGPCAQP